jgi:hypothetical protein
MMLTEPEPTTLRSKSARAQLQPGTISRLEIFVDGHNVAPSPLHIYEGDKR